jgi:hypothetical protein
MHTIGYLSPLNHLTTRYEMLKSRPPSSTVVPVSHRQDRSNNAQFKESLILQFLTNSLSIMPTGVDNGNNRQTAFVTAVQENSCTDDAWSFQLDYEIGREKVAPLQHEERH